MRLAMVSCVSPVSCLGLGRVYIHGTKDALSQNDRTNQLSPVVYTRVHYSSRQTNELLLPWSPWIPSARSPGTGRRTYQQSPWGSNKSSKNTRACIICLSMVQANERVIVHRGLPGFPPHGLLDWTQNVSAVSMGVSLGWLLRSLAERSLDRMDSLADSKRGENVLVRGHLFHQRWFPEPMWSPSRSAGVAAPIACRTFARSHGLLGRLQKRLEIS